MTIKEILSAIRTFPVKTNLTFIVILSLAFLLLGMLLRGCSGCGKEKNEANASHTRTTERHLSLRPDSVGVQITIPPKTLSLKAKANRTIKSHTPIPPYVHTPASSDSLVSLDSVGYFSKGDTSQLYPDTISLFHNLSTNEFGFDLKMSLRKQNQIVKFMARDSLIEIRDSVHTVIKESVSWWHDPLLVLGGVSVGTIIGVLLTLLLH